MKCFPWLAYRLMTWSHRLARLSVYVIIVSFIMLEYEVLPVAGIPPHDMESPPRSSLRLCDHCTFIMLQYEVLLVAGLPPHDMESPPRASSTLSATSFSPSLTSAFSAVNSLSSHINQVTYLDTYMIKRSTNL